MAVGTGQAGLGENYLDRIVQFLPFIINHRTLGLSCVDRPAGLKLLLDTARSVNNKIHSYLMCRPMWSQCALAHASEDIQDVIVGTRCSSFLTLTGVYLAHPLSQWQLTSELNSNVSFNF